MELQVPEVQLAGIAPELALAAGALIILIGDAFLRDIVKSRIYLPWATTATLLLAIALALPHWESNELQLADMIALDGFATFVKVTLAVFALLAVWLGREYLVRENLEESEFYALVLFAIAGMMLMASSADLIMVFIALETFSIALYVLVGFRRDSLASQESAMKYFLLGAFSSAFFLLGIALVYGAVGSTRLYGVSGPGGTDGIVHYLSTTPAPDQGLLVLATALLIVGLGFKVAAVPFHMWTPDVYQGAPAPITGFMAAATKIASFAALIRLLDAVLFPLRWDWRPVVIGIAVATMLAGSILAIVQEDVKRMLAYSSIAHAGFVLTAVVAANDRGIAGALFYLATYGLTILGSFAVVAIVAGRKERRVRLVDFKGLFYSHPLVAGALTLFLLSLAGVPLTSGFVAKLVVFGPAVQADYPGLVVVGVIASAVAAFFYLRVLVVMYMQEAEEEFALAAGPVSYGVVGLTAAAAIVLGLWWGPLIEVASDATFYFG